jgi:hypothetical protein
MAVRESAKSAKALFESRYRAALPKSNPLSTWRSRRFQLMSKRSDLRSGSLFLDGSKPDRVMY